MYTDDTLLTFGTYKYMKLSRVPSDYLLKFLKDKSNLDLYNYVNENEEKLILRKNGVIKTEPLTFPCEKHAFCSEKAAKDALNKISPLRQNHKKPIRSYECNICGGWHLTSIPLRLFVETK